MILGTSMRARQETGNSLFSTSELLALRSGSGGSSEDAPWFPATAYYDQVRRIIESEYVVPVTDQTKVARSSLRFLLRSLGDPETRYFEPEQWEAYTARLSGVYAGIGADVVAQEGMSPTGPILPVVIMSIAPGGPAEKAGLRAGDVIETIDGRWVASRSLFDELQKASDAFTAGNLTRAKYDAIWQSIRDRSERMMSVEEALERLQSGDGRVELVVRRGAETIKAEVVRSATEVSPMLVRGSILQLRHFGLGAGDEFADAFEDGETTVIDLRGNPGGSIDEVRTALAAVFEGGAFAQVRSDPKAPLERVSLDSAMTRKPRTALKVLVDGGTAREAEVFAAALRDVAGAQIEGGAMAGMARRVQRYALPDGSGYAITSGHYHDLKGESLVREDEAVKKARQAAMEAVR